MFGIGKYIVGRPIKILMFGWEFPPFNSGGLGTACLGLVRSLSLEDVQITFVLPKRLAVSSTFAHIAFADEYLSGVTVTAINSLLKPYVGSQAYKKSREGEPEIYGMTLLEEVKLYALRAAELAKREDFDVIHAHDWLSFGAGLAAKQVSGKPLIAHVHATEFDRTGGGANKEIYEMEKQGMEEADAIITVSDFTKRVVADRYGILPQKINVVYNGIESVSHGGTSAGEYVARLQELKSSGKKIVLFVGRITIQKGPDYFLRAAKRVLEHRTDVMFVVAGSGDMEWQVIREAAWLGISDKVIFAGFLRGKELDGLYRAADIFVMPSVSEPFGLTALEAIQSGTPVIMSRQSGVSEVVKNALKIDFWDVDAIADSVIGVLRHKHLSEVMCENASKELSSVSWKRAAQTCLSLYKSLLSNTSVV